MFPKIFVLSVFLFDVITSASLKPCEYVGQYIVDPENCHNFYQCSNTGWVHKFCPSNLVFNEAINVCEWPKPGTSCGNDQHKDSNLKPCEKEGQKKVDTKHCDLFYQCTSCGWSLIECPAGQLFNPTHSVCDKASNVKCASDKEPLGPCTDLSQLKADPEDCGKYYECTPYGWQNMPCPKTQYFNSNTNACDYSYNVQCNSERNH